VADDLLAVARDRTRLNRFWQHLGIEVVDVREGWARLRVRVRDDLRNAPGAPVHGGVYAALVDAAVGCALSTVNEASGGGVARRRSTSMSRISPPPAAPRSTPRARCSSAGARSRSATSASPTAKARSSPSAARRT